MLYFQNNPFNVTTNYLNEDAGIPFDIESDFDGFLVNGLAASLPAEGEDYLVDMFKHNPFEPAVTTASTTPTAATGCGHRPNSLYSAAPTPATTTPTQEALVSPGLVQREVVDLLTGQIR